MIALASASAICVRSKSPDALVQLPKVDRLVPQADDMGPTTRSTLLQILIEPLNGLLQPIDLILRFDEHMTFAGIDDQLCGYA
jgi:hypothetical protein